MGVEGNRAVAIGPLGTGIEALRSALPAFGFTLAARAESGVEGLSLLRALQPRLAVVAAAMPGMDGVAFVRRARTLRLIVQPDVLLLKPPGLRLPDFPTEGLNAALNGLASGAMGLMGRVTDGAARLSMMVMLSYFFLCDRERLLLRLELLIPLSVRGCAVCVRSFLVAYLSMKFCMLKGISNPPVIFSPVR